MAIDKEQWNILASYLTGHSTDSEKASVETWIEASEENKAVFHEAKKIWESAGIRLHYPEIDSLKFLAEVKSRLNDRPAGRLLSLFGQPVWKIAASISLVLVSYFAIRWFTRENIVVSSGNEVATFYLPDSSKVWLNIHSQLTYPRKFNTRNIALEGEAFFSVRKDPNNPFTINTLNTKTEVLGTAFNLLEKEDSAVTLTVAEGSVKFSSLDTLNEQPVIVRAREKATYIKNENLKKSKNNDPYFAIWRERNNPQFDFEKSNPADFLENNYTWKKNQINQSVIEGTMRNNASLAGYRNILLKVTYTKPDGKSVTIDIMINESVYPGKTLSYRKRLLDFLIDTRSINTVIHSAQIVSDKSY